MDYIKSPDCITDDKRHRIVACDELPFFVRCEVCFERFVLVAETVLKEAGIPVRGKGSVTIDDVVDEEDIL